MHTSKILRANHFEYRCVSGGESSPVDFETLFPDYNTLDRLGIVSVPFEGGLRHTGLAVLAWTTAFYDAMRATHPDGFFNYPQHYLFYMVGDHGIVAENEVTDEAMKGWSHLDVWPECKRVASPSSISGIVENIFTYEINRLLWPCSLTAAEDNGILPDHMKRMLRTRMKAIYLYGSDSPTLEIHAAEQARRLTREAGEWASVGPDATGTPIEAHERIDVDEFLDNYLGNVFDNP